MVTATGVVTVAHASAATLGPLLESLLRQEPDAGIVVVDSGSPDGPPGAVEDVPVIALSENVGFGVASNVGAAMLTDVQMLAFLNPDVRLIGPSLSELVREMSGRPDVGIATGPVIDQHGDQQPSAWGPTSPLRAFWFATGWRFPRLRRLVGRVLERGVLTSSASLVRNEVEVDGHVLGGAMFVRRECWDQLGGFDEDFFLYWEDADLCQRARELGWEVAVLPCTPIVHVAGTSSAGVTDEQRWQWYLQGAVQYADKHLTARAKRRLLRALRFGRMLRRRRDAVGGSS